MKRALLAASLLAGVAFAAAPAQAVPVCGQLVGVRCWNGNRTCIVWVGPTNTCV